MDNKRKAPQHTALIIPDGRTRIWQKYPELKGIKIPAKDMFIGKMSSLCRQYAGDFFGDNWYILTTNDKGGPQLVHCDEKITGLYDNPPYPLPGIIHKKDPDKGKPKYWKPFDHLDRLEKDIKRLKIRETYSRIHFLGNSAENELWKTWDKWIKEHWDGLGKNEKKNRDLDIFQVYKSGEYEYSVYCDVIRELFDKIEEKIWLEFPLQNCETKSEMISRITDAISRGFPLRNNSYKVQNVTVKNLFRMGNPAFDYDKIPLTNERGIQIITAPNGFGKSTLFGLLRAVLRGNLQEIATIPFTSLEINIVDKGKEYPLKISSIAKNPA